MLSAHAFVKKFQIKPYQKGCLDHLVFAVKDAIDIANEITGFGNPTWAKTHQKAIANAVCVEQLLLEGATCIGKTVTDEFVYSLLGENYFFDTPLNPKAPDHIPGGSSCGSASAVACELVDFALGTDTAGSTRVPASNCGILGYRPSYGRISTAGVIPFAPSMDSVGILARDMTILKKVAAVLLGREHEDETRKPQIIVLKDILSICDKNVQSALTPFIEKIKTRYTTRNSHLKAITKEDIHFEWLFNTFVILQASEVWNSLGGWLEEFKPELGPITQYNFNHIAKVADRTLLQIHIKRREWFAAKMNSYLNSNKLLCFPTTPEIAPKLRSLSGDPSARSKGTYFPRALGMNAIAGLSRMPQISLPVGEVDGVPIGLSLVAAYGEDQLLLNVASSLLQ